MNRSRVQNAKRNFSFGVINRVLSIVIPFIARTVIIKFLGEEYLGLNTLFTSILQVLSITELGFSSAISASMYTPLAMGDTKKVSALLKLYRDIYKVIGVSILILSACLLPFLPRFISGEVPAGVNIYVLFSIYILNTSCSYMLFAYNITLLNANQRSDITERIGSTTKLVTGILQIGAIVFYKSIMLYVLLTLICSLSYNIYCNIVAKRMYPQYRCEGKVDKSEQQKIKKNIFSLALQKFGNAVSVSIDSIIISSFLGLNLVAIYGNYNYIISSVTMFISLFFGAISAGIGNSVALETKEKNFRNFNEIVFANSWLIGWSSCCFICLSQRFMKIWLGDEFLLSLDVLICIVMCFYINQIRLTTKTYKNATGIWWQDRFRPIVGCVVNLALNIVLVKTIGISGVVISTIISYLVVEIPWETRVLFRDYFEVSPMRYFGDLTTMFIKWIVVIVATYFICSFIPYDIFGMCCTIIVCMTIPNLIMFLFSYSKRELLYSYYSRILLR